MSTFSEEMNNIVFCKEVITYQKYFQGQVSVSYLGISGKTLSICQRGVRIERMNFTSSFSDTSALVGSFGTIVIRLWGQIGAKDGLPHCTMWNEGGSAFTDINRLIFLFGYFAPLISLIACYKLIYKIIKESTT